MAVAEVLGGLGAALSGIGMIGNFWQGYQNYQFQKDNLDYQKSLQQDIFNREDTALQRRMEDAKAAGLNPYSVINSGGANAGSVVKTDAPQLALNMNGAVDAINTVLDMQSKYFNTQQAKASAENAVKDGLLLDADLSQKNWQNKLLGYQYTADRLNLNNLLLDSFRHTAEFNYDFNTDFRYFDDDGKYSIDELWYDQMKTPRIFGQYGNPWYNRNWYYDKDIEVNNLYNQDAYNAFDNWYQNYMLTEQENQSAMITAQRNIMEKENSWYNWNQGFDMATSLFDSVTGLLFKKLDFGLRSAETNSRINLNSSSAYRNYSQGWRNYYGGR